MYWILLVIQYVGMAALFFEILYVSRQPQFADSDASCDAFICYGI